MGRKRGGKHHWNDLKRVYRKRDTLIYREYLGVVDGKPTFGPDVYLCDVTDPPSKLHLEYERITQQDRGTIAWLLKQFNASSQFLKLSPRTRGDYLDYHRLLTSYKMANGRAFGEAPLDRVKRTTIRGYLDKYGAPVAANRHVQYLKSAWYWALERFDGLPDNPCAGVKLNEQDPRARYVTPEEYEQIHKLTSGWVFWAMELAYLCRARRSEVVNYRVSDILDNGLRLRRGKGSEGEITAWTPRLNGKKQ